MRVLVLNAGSSSLKLSLVDDDDTTLAEHDFDMKDGRLDDAQLADLFAHIKSLPESPAAKNIQLLTRIIGEKE